MWRNVVMGYIRLIRLGRTDLAVETGSTEDKKDAWYVGYSPKIVTAVYVGYGIPKTIGARAWGGVVAGPVWVDYMGYVLNGTSVPRLDENSLRRPIIASTHLEGEVELMPIERPKRQRVISNERELKPINQPSGNAKAVNDLF